MVELKNLAIARKRKNLTQAELANQIYVSEKYISLIERGEKTPSLSIMISLCDALDVSLDYLVGRETYEEVQLRELLKKFNKKDIDNLIIILSKIRGGLFS